MDNDSGEKKVDPSMVAEIVSSYVTKNSIAIDQIGGLIELVHRTLSGLGTNAPATSASGNGDPGGADQAIGTARLRCLPRMRISWENPAPTFAHRTWARTGGVS